MWANVSRGLTFARLAAVLTRALVGQKLYPLEAWEASAGLTEGTITAYYPPSNAKRYGATGDGVTDDTDALQLAVRVLHNYGDDTGRQGTLTLPKGTYKVTAPLVIGKNLDVVGEGPNFAVQIAPAATFVGSALFKIDGALMIGGYAFRQRHRGYTVNCNNVTKAILPVVFRVASAYSITFTDVYVSNAQGTAFDIISGNDIVFERPKVYGVTADTTVSEYGIRVHAGSVTLIDPDVEVFYYGISAEGASKVSIVSPYAERNIVGIEHLTTTAGQLSIDGGLVASPGAAGVALRVKGHNLTVVGGRYDANGGSGITTAAAAARPENSWLVNVQGDVSDPKNWLQKTHKDTAGHYPSKVRNYKTPADAVATDFFTITCPSNAAYFGVCEVTVNARDVSGYSLWTAKYRFAFSNCDGTLRATAVTEYGKANLNASGNYSLAITAATNIAGAALGFRLTCDAGGALGNGVAPRVAAEAELVQWDSAGAVYLAAA